MEITLLNKSLCWQKYVKFQMKNNLKQFKKFTKCKKGSFSYRVHQVQVKQLPWFQFYRWNILELFMKTKRKTSVKKLSFVLLQILRSKLFQKKYGIKEFSMLKIMEIKIKFKNLYT